MTRSLALSTVLVLLSAFACTRPGDAEPSGESGWRISALPASVRLDPSSGRIIDDGSKIYDMEPLGALLEQNWIFEGGTVSLSAARGEYVSFQLVLESREPERTLKDIIVRMEPFRGADAALAIAPELFLEWAVEVKAPSTGYERGNLGPGWYPDALIPLDHLQQDVARLNRLSYPLELPDFRNRIDNQRFLLVWIDQFVPFEAAAAPAGIYRTEISVSVEGVVEKISVELRVRDFALPRENRLAGNLQHEGFLRNMDPRLELAVYQLFKRHRVVPADPTYTPGIAVDERGRVSIDWQAHDQRLGKYFSGEAFTAKYGYAYGPGYGEPLEQYVLPFDVYGKYDTPGWPDLGKPEVEREPARQAVYVEAIRQVREHILGLADPQKTRLIVYLNGLDESYFPEAWDRMDFYGKLFDQHFPESKFRVDGSYSPEAMEVIHDAIDYWCCHTIGYNLETIEKYRAMGIQDWFYGPMLYERAENGWCGSSTFMDLPLVNERAISWAAWKYRTLTWCSWGIGSDWEAAWYNSETWKDYFRDHGDGPLSYRRYNGNALAVYAPGIVPGVDLPCATIRLKHMRDGVEEWEMLRMLSEAGAPEQADSAVARIIRRPFGEQSIGELDIWDYHPQHWDKAAGELAETLERATVAAARR